MRPPFLNKIIEPKDVPLQVLKIIFVATAANAIFLSIAFALGRGPGTFIFVGDVFADYLKVVLSYPGAFEVPQNSRLGLTALVSDYVLNNPHLGVEGLEIGALTHFHLPPLSTAYALFSLRLMKLLGPQLVLYLMIFLAVLALYGVAREISSDRRTSAAWLGCFLLSYPSLFILQRANLFSAATSILIIYYMVFLQKGKNTGIAIFLLALAVNIKPNAVIFALGLFLVRDGKVLSRLILFSALSCAVFAASLAVSTALYPAYSIPNFLSALRIWRTMYVVGDLGIAYNSSVFTLLKYIFGYHEYLESSCLLGSLALMLIGFRLYLKRSLNATSFVFVMCAAYMIGTTHSCDYHLLIFFIPLIFLSMEPRGAALSSILCGRNGRSYAVIFVVSCFLLSPKNYIVYYGVSLLVLLNPVVIAAGVVLIYFYSVVSPDSRNEAAG